MKIIDLLSLNEFFETLLLAQPGVAHYLPLSNGEDAVDEISAYYTNDYVGTTAFFQVAEALPKDGLMTFFCSLTIATKPENVSARAGLVARDLTLKMMLEFLGKLQDAVEDAVRTIEEQGDMYDLCIEQGDRIFPIGMLANVNLKGHYVDINVTVPVTHLLYPA